jgi:spore germination protein
MTQSSASRLTSLTAAALVWASSAEPQVVPELEFHFNYRSPAYEALTTNIDNVSLVVPEWFILDGAGALHGSVDPRVLDLARIRGVPVMAQVKNLDRERGAFRADWATDLLSSQTARRRAIVQLLALCRDHDLYGVQIELEGVHISDRDYLTLFIQEAAEALNKEGYRISVSAVHREQAGPRDNSYAEWMWEHWRGVYDLEALGRVADFVRVVAYAQHTRRTPPGPSQSLLWLERVLRHFVEAVPPEKLVLGVGMGVGHWFTVADPDLYHLGARSWNRSITRAELSELLGGSDASPMIWDSRQMAGYAYIERRGVYEWLVSDNDVRAFDAKVDLARELGLRGISLWVTGDEEPGMWSRFRARRVIDLLPVASPSEARQPVGLAGVAGTSFGGVPVLAWHSLVDCEDEVDGPLTDTFVRFEELLEFMAAHGFRSVFPEDARAPGIGPERQVILTFDDGLKEHRRAAEALERHGYRGLFLLIPTRVAPDSEGDSERYLTGQDIARLVGAGHRVAGHGYNHHSLVRSGAEVAGSMLFADRMLRDASGVVPSAAEFAFPYGHYTSEIAALLGTRYRYLLTVNPGYWEPGTTMVSRMLVFSSIDLSFYRNYLLGAPEIGPILSSLTPDGAAADTVRFLIEHDMLPEGAQILSVSRDASGRHYAMHDVSNRISVFGDTVAIDFRGYRDERFGLGRDVIGFALVEERGGQIRFLSPGVLHWLRERESMLELR